MLHNSVIENVSSYKYLGVSLTANLNWETHITSTVMKASRSLAYIQHHLKSPSLETKLIAFNSTVKSQLEFLRQYGTPISLT